MCALQQLYEFIEHVDDCYPSNVTKLYNVHGKFDSVASNTVDKASFVFYFIKICKICVLKKIMNSLIKSKNSAV